MNSKSFWTIIVLGVCGFLPAFAIGQSTEKPKADLGAPGEEHRKLDVLADDWDVIVRFPVGPGKEMEGKSSCEAKWVMDGRFLQQEYSSTFAGKPLTIVRYLGFDRHKGTFVEVQFESTHTDVMYNEGTISTDGKTFTCWGTHIDAADGKEVKVRTVTTLSDKDAFTLQMFYGEGEQAKTITLTHIRKSTP